MGISRQHAETEVTELAGKTCEKLLAAPGDQTDALTVLYLKAAGVWYRIFLDAGVLFLDECDGPDEEDDLEPGQSYVELGDQFDAVGQGIESMVMHDGTLRLAFSSGSSFTLRERADGQAQLTTASRDPRS